MNKTDVLKEIFDSSGAFRNIVSTKHVFLFNEIDDLTAFCSPSIRIRKDAHYVSYELLIVVADRNESPEEQVRSIVSGTQDFVGLPRVTPSRHTLDHFLIDGKLTDWLVADMTDAMQKYTLNCRDALALIEQSDDRFVRSLRNVWGERFEHWITEPLRAKCH